MKLNTFLLFIIAASSVAFIWLEYKPSIFPRAIEVQEVAKQPHKDWRCNSEQFTEKFKQKICR